jgi:hypothetical protein
MAFMQTKINTKSATDMGVLLRAFPAYADRAVASALRSEGWRLKNIVAMAIARGGPDGHKWPQLNPHTGILTNMTRAARKARTDGFGGVRTTWVKNYKSVWRGQKGSKRRGVQYWSVRTKRSTRRSPMLRLRGAVRYIYDKARTTMAVGFVRADARLLSWVKAQAKGYTTPVTARARRLMFAAGFPLRRSTRRLVTPARPLIDPIYNRQKPIIQKNLGTKYLEAVTRYIAAGNTRRVK